MEMMQIRSLRTIENHSGAIYDIVPHPATSEQSRNTNDELKLLFASCSSDGTARIWSCEKKTPAPASRLPKLASAADSSTPAWATGGSEWTSTSRVIQVGGEHPTKLRKVSLDSGTSQGIEALEVIYGTHLT